jgi:hypothetical protein
MDPRQELVDVGHAPRRIGRRVEKKDLAPSIGHHDDRRGKTGDHINRDNNRRLFQPEFLSTRLQPGCILRGCLTLVGPEHDEHEISAVPDLVVVETTAVDGTHVEVRDIPKTRFANRRHRTCVLLYSPVISMMPHYDVFRAQPWLELRHQRSRQNLTARAREI